MKKLLLTLVSLFMIMCSFAQHKYIVYMNVSNATKETINLLENEIDTYNRYIDSNIIYFSTNVNYSVEYIKSIFTDFGIDSININKEKTFATHFVEKAGGVNCSSAEMLCSNTSQTGNSSGGGIQELNSSNQGCMSTEHQSSWYYLNVQTGGTLTMNISPANGTDDYDWAIWGPFTSVTAPLNCPPVSAPIRCSWSAEDGPTGMGPYWGQTSLFGCAPLGLGPCYGWITPTDNSEGAGGDAWVQNLNTSAGQVYILLVDNFSTSSQPYNMSFGGSTVLGCNQIVLGVDILDFYAKRGEYGNIIEWKTLTETNNSFFEVYWNSEPMNIEWKKISTVSSNNGGLYNIIHSNYTKNTLNYYRLSTIDINGTKEIISTTVVDNTFKSKGIIKIVNTLGQETTLNEKGILFIIYNDGEKKRFYNE